MDLRTTIRLEVHSNFRGDFVNNQARPNQAGGQADSAGRIFAWADFLSDKSIIPKYLEKIDAKMSGKRPAYPSADGGEQAYQKRQKIAHVTTSAEDIQSSRQLQQLLAFDQDAGRAKHGEKKC